MAHEELRPPNNDHAMRQISEHSAPLPRWWRHALIAAATLIFCSCSGVSTPTTQTALVAALAAATNAVAEPQGEAAVSDVGPPAATRESLVGQPIHIVPPRVQQGDMYAPESFVQGAAPTGACACDPKAAAAAATAAIPWIGHGDEYLCDGGDFGSPAGVRGDWVVEGVEQEDAIAHYDTLDGRIRVTPSNRVCVYAPRFAAVRQVVNVMASEQPLFIGEVHDELSLVNSNGTQPVASSLQRHAVSINLAKTPPILFRQREQAGGLENLQATAEVYDSLGAYSNLQIVRLGQMHGREEALLRRGVQSAITWTGDQAPQVLIDNRTTQTEIGIRQAGVIYQTDGPDSPRLRLIKLASTGHAQPGEEIEFTLRFDNTGDQVIGNVTIVDNLATRLEYVSGSTRTTADANFIATPNSGGSTVLRWEILAPIEPGQGGVLQFRARVR
jgi:uncharacterized repeat protein (TIGR01451 family)